VEPAADVAVWHVGDHRPCNQNMFPSNKIFDLLNSFDRINPCTKGMRMPRVTAAKALVTRTGLLEAAKQELHAQGYSGLTTRGVAGVAGVPMSQIQYHFGSKEGMVLALFEYLNAQLIDRQNALFNDADLMLSEKWDKACDYLDDDLASGYVRVLHELLVAGWANPEIGRIARDGVMAWIELLSALARQAEDTHGPFGPFSAEDIAVLVGSAFLGAETLLLTGVEDQGVAIRRYLRRFGEIIRLRETRKIRAGE
jgi:AcrR family transcriptional regulator